MGERSRREFIGATAVGSLAVLSGCVKAGGKLGEDIYRAVRRFIIGEAIRRGANEAEEQLEEAETPTPRREIDTVSFDEAFEDEPIYKEEQHVFLRYNEYFAERFPAPANSRLEFEVSGLGIFDFISVYTETEYQKFKLKFKTTGNTDGGAPLRGEFRNGTHIYQLPKKGEYAIVLVLGDTVGERTPSPVNVELKYRIYT